MVGAKRLADVARAAFGERQLDEVTRLRGGSKKGVYRATFADGGTAIFYVWDATEDYWPDGADGDPGAPFAHASGLELYLTARDRLAGLGLRTGDAEHRGVQPAPGADLADRKLGRVAYPRGRTFARKRAGSAAGQREAR